MASGGSGPRFSTLLDEDGAAGDNFDIQLPSDAERRHNANPCVQFANAVSTSRGLQAGLIIGVVLVAIVIIAAAAVASGHKSGGVVVPSNGKDTLTVLIVGDWGRRGSHNQTLVAAQMAATAEQTGADFIISVGDNFYSWGVSNSSDPQFQESWQDVYNKGPLKVLPWKVALGNHDWRGVVGAEIEFSDKDPRWNMPSRYFSFNNGFNGGCASFVFADTSPFVYSLPSAVMPTLANADPDAQLQWLDGAFAEARATCDWVFAIGHHPIYSAGDHGDHLDLLSKFQPLFNKYQVASYIAGHDHDLQHIKWKDFNYIVSGAGSDVRAFFEWDHPGLEFGSTDPGFLVLTVHESWTLYEFIGANGELRYSFTTPKQSTHLRQ